MNKIVVAFVMLLSLIGCKDGDVDEFLNAVESTELELKSLELNKNAIILNANETVVLKAEATSLKNDKTLDMTEKVKWSSSDTAIATVSNAGIVNTIKDGDTIIKAVFAQFSAKVSIKVSTSSIQNLSITAASHRVDECKSIELKGLGLYEDGSTRDLTGELYWSVSDASLATINSQTENNAIIGTLQNGDIEVTLNTAGKSAAYNLSISDTLTAISITPALVTMRVSENTQLIATGEYAASTNSEDITANTAWTLDQTGLAAFSGDTAGRLTAYSNPGMGVITAACGGLDNSINLTVNPAAVLISVQIDEADESDEFELTVSDSGYQLTLNAIYNDADSVEVTDDATWVLFDAGDGNLTVSDSSSSKGELTITGIGEAKIKAIYVLSGVSRSHIISITVVED